MPFPEPTDDEFDDDPSSPTIAQAVQPASDAGIDAFERISGDDLSAEEAARPPVGVLVFSDDLRQPVAGTIVIGREPAHDPRVAAGMALGLAIDDRALMLSRVRLRPSD